MTRDTTLPTWNLKVPGSNPVPASSHLMTTSEIRKTQKLWKKLRQNQIRINFYWFMCWPYWNSSCMLSIRVNLRSYEPQYFNLWPIVKLVFVKTSQKQLKINIKKNLIRPYRALVVAPKNELSRMLSENTIRTPKTSLQPCLARGAKHPNW
jgi:hypothetical protein